MRLLGLFHSVFIVLDNKTGGRGCNGLGSTM